MSKKDYIAIATILKHYKDKMADDSHTAIVGDFCHVLRGDNPRFDGARFMRACGVGEA